HGGNRHRLSGYLAFLGLAMRFHFDHGPIWLSPVYVDASCPAKRLLPQQRQDLAIQVLAGTETVSELARQHEVSRKLLYQQLPGEPGLPSHRNPDQARAKASRCRAAS